MIYNEYKEALHESQKSSVATYLNSCNVDSVKDLTDEQISFQNFVLLKSLQYICEEMISA